jgi:hypothetical protein
VLEHWCASICMVEGAMVRCHILCKYGCLSSNTYAQRSRIHINCIDRVTNLLPEFVEIILLHERREKGRHQWLGMCFEISFCIWIRNNKILIPNEEIALGTLNNLADKRATPPFSYYYCLADTPPLDTHINTHTSLTTKIQTRDRIKKQQR